MNKTPICPTYLQSVQSIDEPLQRPLITLKNKIKKITANVLYSHVCLRYTRSSTVKMFSLVSYFSMCILNVHFFLLTSQPTFSESIKRISFLSGN